MPRSRGRAILALVIFLLSLNALAQVVLALVGRSDDPPALTALQVLVGVSAGAAAWGVWAGARWAAAAAIVYGLATAGLLLALGPLLALEPEARPGLWAGAAVMLLFSLAVAWYLRRAARERPSAGPPPEPR